VLDVRSGGSRHSLERICASIPLAGAARTPHDDELATRLEKIPSIAIAKPGELR
jgi:hypothetical protein